MSAFPNLPEALAAAARESPASGLTIFDRRGRAVGRRTFAEVLESAKQAAARLAAKGIRSGDRVVVALPTSFDWFDIWLGAIHLGALPVATAPGAVVGASRIQLAKLIGVIAKLDAKLIVSTESLAKKLADEPVSPASSSSPGYPVLDTPLPACMTPSAIADMNPASGFEIARAFPENTAFLQLTSGSTGFPRAVQVTHGGAIHNALALDAGVAAPHARDSSGFIDHWASWVPLHHDMGLISNLTLMLKGVDLHLMPSEAFLGRPRLWLEMLASGGRTVATAPNFGYQLCVDRIGNAELEGLDLSNWQVAFSAAEMIRPETVSSFLEKFGRCGFKPENYRPGYGLAEATLVVAIDDTGGVPRTLPVPQGAGFQNAAGGFGLSEVFCVGGPVLDTRLEITAPDGSALPEGQVGEVRASGPGIFTGYYNDPEATAETLVDGWLRTGDLGFLDSGELYLTGRLKDLLIIRGENLMPHELEWLAESTSGGGGLERAAAFSVTHGTDGARGEQIILVLEVSHKDPAKLEALSRDLRVAVGHEFGLTLADVVLVKRGLLPKTTSGKVQRGVIRDRYLTGDLARLA
ncbi:MAG: AMP-binding protein [Acidobacteria bacterium]|nr:AMP-binding protein [Acidobacteriota bacterium]